MVAPWRSHKTGNDRRGYGELTVASLGGLGGIFSGHGDVCTRLELIDVCR
jgi:hypothetical protein